MPDSRKSYGRENVKDDRAAGLGKRVAVKKYGSYQQQGTDGEGRRKCSQITIHEKIWQIIFVGGESMGAILMLLFLLYVGYRK